MISGGFDIQSKVEGDGMSVLLVLLVHRPLDHM